MCHDFSLLHVNEPKQRKVKYLPQGHPANQWRIQISLEASAVHRCTLHSFMRNAARGEDQGEWAAELRYSRLLSQGLRGTLGPREETSGGRRDSYVSGGLSIHFSPHRPLSP